MLERFRATCLALDGFYGGERNVWRSPHYLRTQVRGMLQALGVQTEPVVKKTREQRIREEYIAQEVERALLRGYLLGDHRLQALVIRRRRSLPQTRGQELLDTSLQEFNFVTGRWDPDVR